MKSTSAAARLKAIRESTDLSLQKVADRMDMKLSSYRHYEDRFKGSSFPVEIIDKLLVAFADHPEVEADIRSLITMPQTAMPGMAEPGAKLRGLRLAETLYPDSENAPDITIRVDGKHIQVLANVDRQGIDKLIGKLEIARKLLD